MWFNGRVVDTQDDGRLLTVGEAAELAGVALIDLREQIRVGRLETRRAQRLGDELDLLSLAELIAVYPVAGRREYRPERTLSERGIELVVPTPTPLAIPAGDLGDGLRGQGKEQGASQAGPRDLPQVVQEVQQLERQIEALKSQVHRARTRNQNLLLNLEVASADAQRVLDEEAQPALRRSRLRDRVQREQKSLDRKLSSFGGGASLLGWLAGSVCVICGVLLVTWARSPVYAAAVAPEIPREDQAGLRQAAVLRSLLESAAEATRLADREASLAVLRALEPEPELKSEPEAKPEAPTVLAAVPAAVELPVSQPIARTLEEPLAQVSASSALSLAEIAAISAGAACEMYRLTQTGQPLREVLGPCLGPWNPSLESVVGNHRRGGRSWCRHHFVIASELGGSVVRAKEIAEFSHREGLTAPLMQMRLDHAARASLVERSGAWIESGFESGTPLDHVATRLAGSDHWRLESWVRLADEQGEVTRRHFRVQYELGGAQYLDRELKFEWLD